MTFYKTYFKSVEMKKFLLPLFLLCTCFMIQAQNVGINVTSPQVPLQVYKPGAFEIARFQAGNTDNAYITLWNSLGAKGYLGLFSDPEDIWLGTLVSNPNGALKFATQSSNVRMTILPDGRVGIGTETPQGILDVNGPITFGAYQGPGTAGALRFNGGFFEFHDGAGWVPLGGQGGGPTSWTESPSTIYPINLSKYVGIGINNAAAPLHVYKSGAFEVARFQANNLQNSYLTIWNQNAAKGFYGVYNGEHDIHMGTLAGNPQGKLHFSTESNNIQMTIQPNGRVGIGTQTPASILDVDGAVTFQSFTGAGTEGALRYNGTEFQWHDGSGWQAFSSGGSGGTVWTASGTGAYINGKVGVGNQPSSFSKFYVRNDTETYAHYIYNASTSSSTSVAGQYIRTNAPSGTSYHNRGTTILVENGGTGAKTGMELDVRQASGTNQNAFGVTSEVSSAGTGGVYGNNIDASSIGSGRVYGNYAAVNGSGSGNKYGFYASMGGSGTKYGVYSAASGTSNYAGYFVGRGYFSQNLGVNTTPDANFGLKVNNGIFASTGTNASLTEDGYLQLGAESGENIVADRDEIQARNNGAASNLQINRLGGNVVVGSTTTQDAKLFVDAEAGVDPFRVRTNGSTKFRINDEGQVIINSVSASSPGYALNVDGKIIAEELRVELSSNWPDYVFTNDYKLKSIKEVEAHIKEKHHLPGIPSAKEIEEDGLMVGDMQKRMMEKIEELTLYIIELNTEIEGLKQKIEEKHKH